MPVSAPRTAYTKSKTSTDPLIRRNGCLVLADFYFWFRVGEYMKLRFVIRNRKRLPATSTNKSVVGNIGLLKDGVIIPHTSPLNVLLTYDLAVMNISN